MPFPFKGDSLIGKSNYIEWKTKADLYLEINGYMPYIDGSKEKPNKSLYFKTTIKGDERTITDESYSPETAIKYYERLTEYEENQNKALGALKSILFIENIERFKIIKTAYNLLWWNQVVISLEIALHRRLSGEYRRIKDKLTVNK